MEELGLPKVTTEQIEALCITAEKAARKYVIANFSSKMVERLNVSVEACGTKPIDLEVDVELSSETMEVNLEKIVNEATEKALEVSEKYLRKQV